MNQQIVIGFTVLSVFLGMWAGYLIARKNKIVIALVLAWLVAFYFFLRYIVFG